MLQKKIWANFQRIIEHFTKKIVKKLFKIWSWDPGSRGQKGTGSRITDPDPQHCFFTYSTGSRNAPKLGHWVPVRWVFNELGFIFVIMPFIELALIFQKSTCEGFEPFLTQRLHACLYREDVKFSHLPWSPTRMGPGPFGRPYKGTT